MPRCGQVERRHVAVLGGVLERAADRGPGGIFWSCLVALHLAEGQPQRERGVGIGRCRLRWRSGPWRSWRRPGAAALRPCPRRSCGPCGPCGSTMRASTIIGSSELSIAAWPPSASCLRKATSASFVPGPVRLARWRGDLPARICLTKRIVGAGLFDQIAERIGQLDRLQVAVDRRLGEELLLERIEAGFGILAEPLGVRLGRFLGQPHQRAGDVVQLAVEGRAAFVELVVDVDLVPDAQRARTPGPRRRACRAAWGRWRRPGADCARLRCFALMMAGSCRPASPPSRALRLFW